MNETTVSTNDKPGRWKRVTALAGVGLLAGLIAAGAGSVASAQTVITDETEPAAMHIVGAAQTSDEADEGTGHGSEADAAVFERFEQCLRDAGVDIEADGDLDDAAIDAAFDQCDPILDELSEGAHGGFELSPEDEAVIERYDTCLERAGIDFEVEGDLDDAAIDAAFDQCDPILDELSEDAMADFEGFGDLSPEDEAVFERYDTCLEGAGIDFEVEGDLDDAAIDAAFDQCDPILDELSEEAQELFADCPEDE